METLLIGKDRLIPTVSPLVQQFRTLCYEFKITKGAIAKGVAANSSHYGILENMIQCNCGNLQGMTTAFNICPLCAAVSTSPILSTVVSNKILGARRVNVSHTGMAEIFKLCGKSANFRLTVPLTAQEIVDREFQSHDEVIQSIVKLGKAFGLDSKTSLNINMSRIDSMRTLLDLLESHSLNNLGELT